VRTPAQEKSTFKIEPGFTIELVASEPMVQEPVAMSFDRDGRLWVVEMRGFMPDIAGKGEVEKSGRISILEDQNGDGVMDKSTIYLDGLILPRALGLIKGGALISENKALWLTQDTNGDLKADTKVLLDSTYAKNGAPEHSDNGLLLNLDNWYYNVKSRLRYRLMEGKWQRDSTEFRGQWGMSHDDQGRLFYNYNWSQLHADLVPANSITRNKNHSISSGIDHGLTTDRRIYPIRSNPAINRGYIEGTLDKKGRLREFTAACSPLVLRSTLFPTQYYGNALVCEPAGNLIKRNVVTEKNGILRAYDPNPQREFLASTDERFRPTQMALGPDGALYIADMYHGIIQHGSYMTPYLKEQNLKRKLDAPIHMGRIWRIVPKGKKVKKVHPLQQAGGPTLISYLSHPDGFYRDMAQRLLIEKQDKSLIPELKKIIQKNTSTLGRLHALWTLEGLQAADKEFLTALILDENSLIKNNALRLLSLIPNTPTAILDEKLLAIAQRAKPTEAVQLALSVQMASPNIQSKLLGILLGQHIHSGLLRDAVMSSLWNREYEFLSYLISLNSWVEPTADKEIMLEMITSAVVKKGKESEIKNLLALIDSKGKGPFTWKEKVLLTSLAIQAPNRKDLKPIQLVAMPAIFKEKNKILDENKWIVLENMFHWPQKTMVSQKNSKSFLDEKSLIQFAEGRQKYLATCSGCHGVDGKGITRFAPPLRGSEWVLGDATTLSLIVLHGMEGPMVVAGKKYDAPAILPVMPAHSTMGDADIASILTYIRNEWGNQAEPVLSRFVFSTRNVSQGRVYPWKTNEIKKYVESLKKPN
jgi:cytochrome c553